MAATLTPGVIRALSGLAVVALALLLVAPASAFPGPPVALQPSAPLNPGGHGPILAFPHNGPDRGAPPPINSSSAGYGPLSPPPPTRAITRSPSTLYPTINIVPQYPEEYSDGFAYDSEDHYDLLTTSDCCDVPSQGSLEYTWAVVNGTYRLIESPTQPLVFSSRLLADDPHDGYVVELATYNQTNANVNQTWTYRGGNWTELHPSVSPPANVQGTEQMIYDPAIGKVVYFYTNQIYNSTTGNVTYANATWLFSGGNWTEALNSTPTGFPEQVALAYDPVDGYLMAEGSTTVFNLTHFWYNMTDNSTWKFVSGTWQVINTSTRSPAEIGGSMIYDPTLGQVIEFGGFNYTASLNENLVNVTYAYSAGKWTGLAGYHIPNHPTNPSLALSSPNGTVLAYAGLSWFNPSPTYPTNSTGTVTFWQLNNSSWQPMNATDVYPAGRCCVQSAYDSEDGYFLAFGGTFPTGFYSYVTLNDTWAYQHGRWVAVATNASPPGRYYGVMADDPADGYVVMFGGQYGSGYYGGTRSDTWTYRAGNWSQLHPTTTPSYQEWGCMAYDAADKYVVLYGGYGSSGSSNQTWKFSAGNWTNLTSKGGPPAMNLCSLAYDTLDSELVLVGSAYTWVYHAGIWTNETKSVGPSNRQVPLMAYDPQLGGVILYGGDSGRYATFDDLWVFSHGNWTQLRVGLNPDAVGFGGMAYDPVMGSLLLFDCQGGYNFLSQMWVVGENISFAVGSTLISPARIDLGQSTSLEAGAIGGTGVYTYNWTALPPGCSAANQSTLACSPNATGTFPVNVTVSDSNGSSGIAPTAYVAVSPAPTLSAVSVSPSAIDVRDTVNVSVSPAGGTAPDALDWTGLPPGCASSTAASFTCSPSSSGTFTLHARMTDAAGETAYSNGTLQVNGALSLSGVLAQPATIDRGQSTTFSTTVSGGTSYRIFVWSGLPSGCTGANASSLTCLPNVTGSFHIEVNATDSLGELATATTALLTVNPPLRVPAPTANNLSEDVGHRMTWQVGPNGGTSPFIYNWQGLPPGCVGLDAATIPCSPSGAGSFNVSVTVIDTAGVSATGPSTPFEVYLAPTVSPVHLSAGVVDAGVSWTANVTVVAVGAFNVSWTGLPAGCSPPDKTAVSLTCTSNALGSFTITATATDARSVSVASAKATLTIQAGPTVSTPTVSPHAVDVGQKIDLSGHATATSGLSVRWIGVPPGCTAPAGIILSWSCTPTTPGTYTIQLVAGDGTGFNVSSPSASLTVDPALSVGTAVVTVAAPVTNESFDLVLNSTGGSGIARVVWSLAPPGCAAIQGTWNESCAVTTAGNYSIQFSATDTNGVTVQSPLITISVTNASVQPISHPANPAGTGGGSAFWLWVGIAAAALVVALGTVWAVRRRRRPPQAPTEEYDETVPE